MPKVLEDRAEPSLQSPGAQDRMGTQASRQSFTRQEGHRGRRTDPGLGVAQRKGSGRGLKLGAGWPGPGGQHTGLRSGGEEQYGLEQCSQFGVAEE